MAKKEGRIFHTDRQCLCKQCGEVTSLNRFEICWKCRYKYKCKFCGKATTRKDELCTTHMYSKNRIADGIDPNALAH